MLVDVVGCINSKKCTKMCLNIVFVAQFEIDVWHGFFLRVLLMMFEIVDGVMINAKNLENDIDNMLLLLMSLSHEGRTKGRERTIYGGDLVVSLAPSYGGDADIDNMLLVFLCHCCVEGGPKVE